MSDFFNPITEEEEQKAMQIDVPNNSDEFDNQKNDISTKSFIDGVEKKSFSLDDHIKKLSEEPKQDYTNNFDQDKEEKINDFDDEGLEDDFFNEKTNQNAKKNAENITRWGDTLIAFFLSFWSGEEDFTRFKAEKKSLVVIEESLTAGFNTMKNDITIPWWSGLMLEVPVAYFDKIKTAIRLRKKNQRAKKEAEKAEKNKKEPVKSFNDQVKQNSNSTITDVEEYEEINSSEFHPNGKRIRCASCDKVLTNGQKSVCDNKCKKQYLKKINSK